MVLPIRLPLPVLRYARFDLRLPHVTSENAQDLRALRTSQKPLLVNFWASWCEPCLSELQDVTTRAADIRAAGLDILALTVDGLDEGKATGRTDARKMVESLAYPFEVGLATPEMLDKLELIQKFLFHRLPRSSIPASYLLDRHGRLAVLYRGPVNVDEVLNDVANLGASPEELRDLSVPFSGRWNGRVSVVALRFLAKEFEGQYVEDYVTYLGKAIQQQELNRSQAQEKRRRHELDKLLAQLHLSLAEALLRQDNVVDAIAHYRHIVELLPEASQARINLGNALMADGKLEEAMDLFRHVLNQDSTFTDAHFNLAQALRSVGKLEEAAFHFEEILRHNPADPHAHLNLGSWLISQHKIEEAIDHYRQALKHDPEYIEAHYELARALKFQGHVSAAIMEYREVLRRTLNHGRAHFDLGMLLYRQGNVGLTIDHLQETIRLIPDWPKALNAASWIWATCPDAAVRQPATAVRLAQKAATLTGRRDPLILDTLAAAYAADGQFEMAISTAQAALELALSNQAQTLADKIRERLELYRQEQPYIESV